MQEPSPAPLALDDSQLRLFVEEVDRELKRALREYAGIMPPSLIRMGKQALHAPGKVMLWAHLTSEGREEGLTLPRWPLLVLLAYQAAAGAPGRGSWREVLPVAVAVEISMAAADLLDELADDDPSPIVAEHGPGQALNTGCLMLVMAQQVLLRHAAASGGTRALAALDALQNMLVEAAVGQHLDMLYEKMPAQEVTPEMSIGMTEKKAGALMSGACRAAALMSGADERTVELTSEFGRHMGGIAQIVNDIQDVLPISTAPNARERKTDLRLRKRTLPIVFTLRDDSPEPNALQLAFSTPGSNDADEEVLRRAVIDAGGVQFAQLIVEVHREKIEEIVAELEQTHPGAREVLAPLLAQQNSAS